MAAAPRAPHLRGLRVAVPDAAAAAALLGRVLALPAQRDAAPSRARLQLGPCWIDLRDMPAGMPGERPGERPGDMLELQCDDLARQRTHLRRLGIEALDGAVLGCTPCLRLETVDTGACMVDLHEAPGARRDSCDGGDWDGDDGSGSGNSDGSDNNERAPRAARLCGVELAVRSPERVALHWAQLFQARSLRDARALPTLAFDGGLELRFALSPDGHAGVTGMDFSVDSVEALLRNAPGIDIRRQDARRACFDALGIRFGLQSQA